MQVNAILLAFIMWSLFKFYRDSRRRQFRPGEDKNEAVFLTWRDRQVHYKLEKLPIINLVVYRYLLYGSKEEDMDWKGKGNNLWLSFA